MDHFLTIMTTIIGAYFQTPQIRIRLSALDCYRARTYNTGVQLVGYQSIKTNLYNEQSIINACKNVVLLQPITILLSPALS